MTFKFADAGQVSGVLDSPSPQKRAWFVVTAVCGDYSVLERSEPCDVHSSSVDRPVMRQLSQQSASMAGGFDCVRSYLLFHRPMVGSQLASLRAVVKALIVNGGRKDFELLIKGEGDFELLARVLDQHNVVALWVLWLSSDYLLHLSSEVQDLKKGQQELDKFLKDMKEERQ